LLLEITASDAPQDQGPPVVERWYNLSRYETKMEAIGVSNREVKNSGRLSFPQQVSLRGMGAGMVVLHQNGDPMNMKDMVPALADMIPKSSG
jgi:hypothetical protein